MVEPFSTALATIATKEAISAFVKPLITASLKGMKNVGESVADMFSDRFARYVDRQLEKHSYLNTLVFQNQIPLEELYIPLTLVRAADAGKDNLTINRFPASLLENHSRVLITDTAGMGKSTLLRFILIQCVRSNFAIPIFIELRHLSQTQELMDLIEREINLNVSDGDRRFAAGEIGKLLGKGGFVFFLDGYDEISFKERESVTRNIKDFVESYPKNVFLMTSRAEGGLAAFPSFLQFKIRPLKQSESFDLIRKYDRNGSRSKQLIERLRGRELNAVRDFLKNPLLTTLLYRCFEYKQNVPEKKHIFYRQVFDALYDWHDASKDGYNTREKKSKLDLDSFHRVLRVIGFISTLNGEIEGDKDKVLGWIRQAKHICVGLSFSESDFLEDLTQAVPIFTKDGLFYKWSHKSLAEYFAAQYICTEGKAQQEKVFTYLYREGHLDRFKNMIDQIYDLDPAAFRRYFTYPFAKEAVAYRASSYKNVDPAIPASEVELRRAVTFGGLALICKGSFDSDLDKFLHSTAEQAGQKSHSVQFGLSVFKPKNLKDSVLVLRVVDTHCVISSILSAKRDPLIIDIKKLDQRKQTAIVGLGRSCALPVRDDPANFLNRKENFASVSTALAQNGAAGIVDIGACKAFCDSFDDEQARENFTTNLLSNIFERTG
jgi:hypothetical protein